MDIKIVETKMAKKLIFPDEEFILAERVNKVLFAMHEEKDCRVPEYIELLDGLLRTSSRQFDRLSVNYEKGVMPIKYRTPSRDIFNYMELNHPDLYGRVQKYTAEYAHGSHTSSYSFMGLVGRLKDYIGRLMHRRT